MNREKVAKSNQFSYNNRNACLLGMQEGLRLNQHSRTLGYMIIALALFILLGKLGVFYLIGVKLWPLFVLLIGLGLHYLFFKGLMPNYVLMPGGFLTVFGAVMLWSSLFGWGMLKVMWPFIILGIAVGLYEWYRYHPGRPSHLLVPAIVIGSVSLFIFGMLVLFHLFFYIIVILLIVIGSYFLFRRTGKGNRKF